MDWHYLGHAMWLAELGEIRLLFDPLLSNEHHGGVFEVEPLRDVDVEALAPDFIVCSHLHPDHFDIKSLATLARLDADTVLFTADELVAQTALRVGFRTVRALETWSRVDLQGARFASTPSYTDEVEWGVMVETDDGVVWNQIDSYHPSLEDVRDTLVGASRVFARDLTDPAQGLALAMVRWQPVLETQGPLGDSPGFPYREYADALGRIAMTQARAVIPAAAGVRQRGPYAFMNHYVYPVPLARLKRDLAKRVAGLRVLDPAIGATYRVRRGETSVDRDGARSLVRVREGQGATGAGDPAATSFRPFEMPPLVDVNPNGLDRGTARAAIEAWVRGALADGLARSYPSMGTSEPLRFTLEAVFDGGSDAYTLEVRSDGATVRTAYDHDYDALVAVSGSLLGEVVLGRRQWGDPLLGGMLRACVRAYDVNEQGLAIARVSPTWPYLGLSYEQSVKNATEHELRSLGF